MRKKHFAVNLRRRWTQPNLWPMRPARAHLGVFSPAVREQTSAIACSLPRSQDVSLARWSRAELARHVAASPGLPRVSASTIGRWLQAEKIRPWRYRMWQTIQNPASFLAQGAVLLQAGTWSSVSARKPRSRRVELSRRHAQRSVGEFHGKHRTTHVMVCVTCLRVECCRWAGVSSVRAANVCRFPSICATSAGADGPEARSTHHRADLTSSAGCTNRRSARLEADVPSVLAAEERFLAGSDRNLVQCIAIQTPTAQSFPQYRRTRSSDPRLHQLCNQTAKPIKWSYTIDKLERKLGMN